MDIAHFHIPKLKVMIINVACSNNYYCFVRRMYSVEQY